VRGGGGVDVAMELRPRQPGSGGSGNVYV
jgi:hypothetical protein